MQNEKKMRKEELFETGPDGLIIEEHEGCVLSSKEGKGVSTFFFGR